MDPQVTQRTRRQFFSSLDVKLAGRMLARYPALSVIGTVALAVAIALGAFYFEVLNKWQHPRLPIAAGERVVAVRVWDAKASGEVPQVLSDFANWRRAVTTIDHLGAAILFQRNLATPDRRVEPVHGAEISASAFQIMGTAPLLGRALTERDEDPGEPPVVVIGERIWKNRFDSAPGVVGRTVQLGTVTATIVGVMPAGFGFPQYQGIWLPLRADGSLLAPRTGPRVEVFGRLKPGVSLQQAQAELDALGTGMAATPEDRQTLRPRVLGYGKMSPDGETLFMERLLYAVNTVFLLLLAVVSMNVATLVFARTAARGWEMTVRSALGASRGRIVGQLFVEALALSGLAAVLGLLVARLAMGWGVPFMAAQTQAMPFWVDASLSWRTVLYAAALAVFGAAIVGILPALRFTRVNVADALRGEGAASSPLRFGGFWTTVIVLQVAFTVAFIPLAANGIFESNRFSRRAEGIGAERFLAAGIAMDREDHRADSAAFANRARASVAELERRLRAEPDVEQVAFADRLPVEDQFKYGIEVDSTMGAPADGLRSSTLVNVSAGFFAAFGTSLLAGRDFASLDFTAGHVMIVNESFARNVFRGRNAIGQRVRIARGEVESLAGPDWYEIVGVVQDFGWQLPRPEEQSAMYLPSLPVAGRAGQLAVRVRDPEGFGERLRVLAASVDPTLRLTDIKALARAGGGEATINWTLTAVAGFIAFMVLLLSTSGIHSLMSFTVSRRTREIGIRAALGGKPGRIVAAVFTRAFLQISAGLVAGSALVAWIGVGSSRQMLLLLVADGIMLAAGLTACALPLRRALGINPTEALRAGG